MTNATNSSESPLTNIYDNAFALADELSVDVNNSIQKMLKKPNFNGSISDAIILHSVAMMLMICMMNREVLETGELEMTFAKVKGITNDYLRHVLDLPRERKGEGDDDDVATGTANTTLNS